VRILIADFDTRRSEALTDACEARGHRVLGAPHGAAALELALEHAPEVVVCPVDLAVIDGARLEEILRGNPRTRHASFVFLVKDELDAPMAMDPRDATVVSPWSAVSVLERIEAVVNRTQRFGGARPASEIEGNLSQISVVDLLEIFQMNQKSGTVRIWGSAQGAAGMIVVKDGQVSDASVPLTDGSAIVAEKALYRLLTWTEGRFEFAPGDSAMEPGRIHKPTRALIMEGMRQIDEWARIRAELPPEDGRLALGEGSAELAEEGNELTREALEAVQAYRRVRDVVDHCAYPDYQVLRVLAGLLARGVLTYDQAAGGDAGGSSGSGLFTPNQLRRLREWAAAQRSRPGSVLKVVVSAGDAAVLGKFHEALRECPDFMSDPRLLRDRERRGRLGPLGHFPLGHDMSLRLLFVPPGRAYTPLWAVASHGAVGAILLPAGPVGSRLSTTKSIGTHLQSLGPRRLIYLFFEPHGEIADDVRSELLDVEDSAIFALPESSTEDRVARLCHAFGRLLP